MTRVRSTAIALVALALSAGAAFAFTTLPDAASQSIDEATEMSGRTIPARPAAPAGPPADVPPVDLPDAVVQSQLDVAAEDLPDAAQHGVDVSTVARGDDPTPDTNRGADVSEAARDNAGQATAADKRPENAGPQADAGKPDGAGKPEGAGQPADPGKPDDPGPPAGAGKPEGVPPAP
jgi:hypothetical protein